jgi:hypothetical protein
MSIKTSKHSPSADIGNDIRPLKGDAQTSIESQLANLESLHQHEANQAEDQDDLFGKDATHKGGLHSSAALSAHLEKYHGPKFAGSSK